MGTSCLKKNAHPLYPPPPLRRLTWSRSLVVSAISAAMTALSMPASFPRQAAKNRASVLVSISVPRWCGVHGGARRCTAVHGRVAMWGKSLPRQHGLHAVAARIDAAAIAPWHAVARVTEHCISMAISLLTCESSKARVPPRATACQSVMVPAPRPDRNGVVHPFLGRVVG